MADSSTDTSIKDLESVYVRLIEEGKPVNTFISVSELITATSDGHKAAIEQGIMTHYLFT